MARSGTLYSLDKEEQEPLIMIGMQSFSTCFRPSVCSDAAEKRATRIFAASPEITIP